MTTQELVNSFTRQELIDIFLYNLDIDYRNHSISTELLRKELLKYQDNLRVAHLFGWR